MKKVASWNYKTRNGVQIGVVNRFESNVDNIKSSKQIIPCFKKDSQGQFISGIPESINNSRPLFGLETIKENKTIYIVEGEKCAQALTSAFGYACLTTLGGSKNARKSKYTELSGINECIIIPDKDKPGFSYANDIYSMVKHVCPTARFSLVELEGLPEKGDFCDWVQARVSKQWDEFQPLNETLSKDELLNLKYQFDKEVGKSIGKIPPTWDIKTGSKGLACAKGSTFIGLNFPPPKHFLSPWLQERSLNMIYANRGVGKTFFALNCAYSAASGKDFLKYKALEKTPVIYLDGEMQAPLMIERLKGISGGNLDNIPLYIVNPDLQGDRGVPDISTLEGQSEIDEMIEEVGAKVIFVDNLSTLSRSGQENDSDSWNPIQMWAIKHRSKGRSVVFIHHSNKGGGQRGTSKKEDILDNVLFLKRPEDYDEGSDGAKFEVHFEKNRSIFGQDVATILASLDSENNEWSWSYIESKEEKALVMYESQMTQAEIAKEMDVSKSCVCKMIQRAKEARKNNQ